MDAIKMGMLIKTARTEKKMTQKQLAEMLNVSVPAISKWENGHGYPDISLLIPLASSLDISVSELLNGERSQPEMSVMEESSINDVIQLSVEQGKRKVRLAVILAASIVAIAMIVLSVLFQNVGIFHNYFSPAVFAYANPNEKVDEWQAISFDGNDYLCFDSLFFSKKCVNDANSSGEIQLQFMDRYGNIVIDNAVLNAGESMELKQLEKNKDYVVKIKCGPGQFFLRFY